MGRRRTHVPLIVSLNGRRVGILDKEPTGAIAFQYDQDWLDWEFVFPISLSLPLRPDAYRGAKVVAVFENLLPDSDVIRGRVALQVGAAGTDAYHLLSAIGHDCVGAMRFTRSDANDAPELDSIDGEVVTDSQIERILSNLERAPLGLVRDDSFRISIAGAQEKTALLWHNEKWLKPKGSTPTTHIFKTPIGQLPNGIDLSNSVENEWYCLKLAAACGLLVNSAEIGIFGSAKALIVERFDRQWTRDGRLLRLPQEDCCQALSVPPSRKYQSDQGPSLHELLNLIRGADDPYISQKTLIMAQALFYLIGATDGHAKNFSVFIYPGGRFALTPLYDILTAQPSLDAGHIQRKQMKLAMSVGRNRHYKFDEVFGRHFVQTADRAGLSVMIVEETINVLLARIEQALQSIEEILPADFPAEIHTSVVKAVKTRIPRLHRLVD